MKTFIQLTYLFLVPAHFRVKHVNHSGIAGHSIVLSCEAEGEGPIGITWNTSPGAQVFTKQTSNSVISELHLEYLTRRHAGVYRCTATNRFGQDYMAIYLSVKGRITINCDVWFQMERIKLIFCVIRATRITSECWSYRSR